MNKKEIENIVKTTIKNLDLNNDDNIVLDEKEYLLIKDNISYMMAGFFGLKLGMQNNPNMVNLFESYDKKCIEILKLLDKKKEKK
jgi:hypothetical protein